MVQAAKARVKVTRIKNLAIKNSSLIKNKVVEALAIKVKSLEIRNRSPVKNQVVKIKHLMTKPQDLAARTKSLGIKNKKVTVVMVLVVNMASNLLRFHG